MAHDVTHVVSGVLCAVSNIRWYDIVMKAGYLMHDEGVNYICMLYSALAMLRARLDDSCV